MMDDWQSDEIYSESGDYINTLRHVINIQPKHATNFQFKFKATFLSTFKLMNIQIL